MSVRYFLIGIISVFLFSVFAAGVITVYRNSNGVVSRDEGITVAAENEDTYIISVGDDSFTLSSLKSGENRIAGLLTPAILKAENSLLSVLKDFYVDFLKNLEEKT